MLQLKKSLFTRFLESEKSSGFVLIFCTIISLLLANSSAAHHYLSLWHLSIFNKSLEFWINDGLMTGFFLLVGLEIKKELLAGDLADRKSALLPVLAAIGGMIVPALIHLGFNNGTPAGKGFGIPMATDIAFSLAILSLLGKRVPASLKVFLTALAIIDDLGAIVVIALFYTSGFSWMFFAAAVLVFIGMLVLNRLKVQSLIIYLIIGIVLWYCIYRSGIHATIAGVLVAFALPFNRGNERAPAAKAASFLHLPVAFLILPVFALANTCIQFPASWQADLLTNNSLGIVAGLLLGKPLGIFICCLSGIGIGWCRLPSGVSHWQLLACASLAGIGFTMSVFITLLAFTEPALIDASKIAVILGSVLSALVGYVLLRLTLHERQAAPDAGLH